MLNLIGKDFIFTKKQAIIGIIYCLAVPILLLIDGGDKLYWAQFFIPFCMTSFLLSKIFSKEDVVDVRYFLKLLPYSTYKRVGARYCFMLIILLFSEAYLWLVQCVVFKQSLQEVAIGNIIPIIIFLLYYSLYIMLAYCFGYYVAQNSIYGCMLIAGILAVAYEKMDVNINFAAIVSYNNIVALTLVSIGITFLCYFLSCKGERVREK